MDNSSFQPMQPGVPQQPIQTMPPVQAAQPLMPAQPAMPGQPQMIQQVQVQPKKDNSDLIKTIVIIILTLISLTFIGLFIWMFIQYNDASTNLESKISIAVADAKKEQEEIDDARYVEEEKNPYKDFAGPTDYGTLSFQYPKTWNLYIEDDAANGGDYVAYFNPDVIEPISDGTINALRLFIYDETYDDIIDDYEGELGDTLSVETITVNGDVTANKYSGILPGMDDLEGYIVIIKIRDKTAIFQTDSVLFKEDFDKVIESITFSA